MIEYQVLGQPGRDNALLLRINSGQSISRLLFDCGEGCLSSLSISQIRAIDHLCFSHLHMDHVGGFDSFFRCTFGRDNRDNQIWAPAGSAEILQHRFRGFWWNLTAGQAATWRVGEIGPENIATSRFELAESFATRHEEGAQPSSGAFVKNDLFAIEALHLQHHGPCLGYLVSEPAKRNIAPAKLAALGLKPGPWLSQLKSSTPPAQLQVGEQSFDSQQLLQDISSQTPGSSIAYLTDFLLDEATEAMLAERLAGCRTVVCEAQYRHDDLELAQRNAHTTTTQVARMAKRAKVGQLILCHLSDRYSIDEWREMLEECRAIFPATSFPKDWQFDS